MTYKQRYQAAHEQWFQQQYPQAYRDGFYCSPKMPKVNTANGLTQFIINFIDWNGYHANRISSAGRFMPATNKWDKGSFIPSTTKKGTADISAVLKGRAVMIEIKIGSDRPSAYQLEQQQLIRAAGGVYEFVSTPEGFFAVYDAIVHQTS